MDDRDQLEFAISQYLDGMLPPLERNALERRLAEDVEARDLLAQYRRLDQVLKQSKDVPMPAVQWDRFADHIAQAVAREEPPVRHYSIEWVRWGSRVAVAASLLLAAGIGLVVHVWDSSPISEQPVHVVVGPAEPVLVEPTVDAVTIGPPRIAGGADLLHAEEVIARPTRIIVAAANDTALDRRRTLQ